MKWFKEFPLITKSMEFEKDCEYETMCKNCEECKTFEECEIYSDMQDFENAVLAFHKYDHEYYDETFHKHYGCINPNSSDDDSESESESESEHSDDDLCENFRALEILDENEKIIFS